MSVSPSPGRFSAQCITLLGILSSAYPVKPQDSIPGMPGWGTTALFDIDARVNDETAAALGKLPRDEQWKLTKQMIQALLADRFKLRTRMESRKGQIYSLVTTKHSNKLNDAPGSEGSGTYSWGNGSIQIRKGQIGSLVSALSDTLGHPVVDKTGLTGNYDINLKWAPAGQQGSAEAESALSAALEEQLGLKLESNKGMVDVFVIDHAEQP